MVFDVSLGQIALVFVVGAATLGPRDLPRAARTAGYLMGRASKYLKDSAATANQLMREAEIPELKQEIQQSVKDMERIRNQIQAATRIKMDPFSGAGPGAASPSTSNAAPTPASPPPLKSDAQDSRPLQESHRLRERPPPAPRGSEAPSTSNESSALERELEAQLRQFDATQPKEMPKGGKKPKRTLTEQQPSGADVVVECLRQQRFNRDCRNLIRDQIKTGQN